MRPTLILLIAVIVVIGLAFAYFNHTTTPTVSVTIGTQVFRLEVASTYQQKASGLSRRDSLCPTCGMIFVFNSEFIQQFWMKDTRIPLDIIFLDNQGKVINIVTAQPQPGVPDSQLSLHRSTAPSQYVIEINAHMSSKVNLKLGDIITLPQF